MNDPQRVAEEIVKKVSPRISKSGDLLGATYEELGVILELRQEIAQALTAHGNARFQEASQEKDEEIRKLKERVRAHRAQFYVPNKIQKKAALFHDRLNRQGMEIRRLREILEELSARTSMNGDMADKAVFDFVNKHLPAALSSSPPRKSEGAQG